MLSFPIAKLLINSCLVFTCANIEGIHDLVSSGFYLINFKPLLWDIILDLVSTGVLISSLVGYTMLNIQYLILVVDPAVYTMINGKTSIHIIEFVLYLGFHFHHWWNSLIFSIYFIIGCCWGDIFMYYLHLVQDKYVLGGVFIQNLV